MKLRKRIENEKKFSNWYETSEEIRIYYYDIIGKFGWKARYVKEVDNNENTLRFYLEIYNGKNILVEIHEKYPIDKGHKVLK